MCYFLYLGLSKEIPESILTMYQQEHDIYIDEIKDSLSVNIPRYYYLIHRQCSCDFIRDNNNSYDALSKLFKNLAKPIDVILLDANITPDIDDHLSEVITSEHLTQSLRLNKFLSKYPTNLVISKVYRIP